MVASLLEAIREACRHPHSDPAPLWRAGPRVTGEHGGHHTRSWLTAPVLAVGALSVAAGISAFGVTVVIGDVAADLGQPTAGDDTTFQLGSPVTTIGIALAVIRLASLASLPLAALADRLGGRRLLLTVAGGPAAVSATSAGWGNHGVERM
jgi:MFS family permease